MMQAIGETLFDVVYLISVITIGILMIRGSKGNRQFLVWMDGGGAVGGCHPYDRNVDDSKNMCLCVDRADRIFCHEAGMSMRR